MLAKDIIECSLHGCQVFLVVMLLLCSAILFIPDKYNLERCQNKTTKTPTETPIQSITQKLSTQREFIQPLLENQWSIDKSQYCYFKANCETIKCSHISEPFDPGEETSIFIEKIFKVECDSNIVTELIIEKSTFAGNELRENWLKTDVAIEKLTLLDCSLMALSDRAFSPSGIYSRMKKLYLVNNNISTLRKATFRYLPSLRELSIQKNEIKQAERNLLEDVAGTLQSLQFEENAIVNAKVLQNITGGRVLHNVKILSLRYNRIPIIDSQLFSGVPGVVSLYLSNSHVNTVHIDAFEPISESIAQLLISDNDITTLPEGLFDKIIWNPSFILTIDNNPWHCDCNLEWMRDTMRNHPSVNMERLICKSPEKNADKSFTVADFCDGDNATVTTSTSVTKSSTTNSSETPSTTNTSETPSTIDCKARETICIACNITANQSLYSNCLIHETFSRSDLAISLRFWKFSAEEVENRMIRITLPSCRDVSLIWFINNERSNVTNLKNSIRCAGGVRDSFLLKDLKPQTSYTICAYDGSNFSPLNCLGVTTSSESRSVNAIILFVVLLILMCCMSAFLMFVTVRRHPAMLRGSKRIVIVKRQALDAVVLPKGLSSEAIDRADGHAVPTISRNLKENAYVPPLPPARTNSIRKNSRSSALSVQSDGMSYVSSIEPTLSQLNLWRVARARYMNREAEPPPLPPHPQSNVAQPLSTVTDLDEDEFADSTYVM